MRIPYFLLVLTIFVVVVICDAKKHKDKSGCHGCNNHHGGNHHGGNYHGGNHHGGNYHGNKHHGGYHHKRDVSSQDEPSPKPIVVVDISVPKQTAHGNAIAKRRSPPSFGKMNPKSKGQVVPIKSLIGIPKPTLKPIVEHVSLTKQNFGPIVGTLTKA